MPGRPRRCRRDTVGDDVPDTYNWLLEMPFWDESPVGQESRMFTVADFLARSHRSDDADWSVHFRRWCEVRRGLALDLYDARSLGLVQGVDMLIVTRDRASGTSH